MLLLPEGTYSITLIHFVRDGFKKKKKLMEFSIKGPDPASQHLNEKKNKKHGLKML